MCSLLPSNPWEMPLGSDTVSCSRRGRLFWALHLHSTFFASFFCYCVFFSVHPKTGSSLREGCIPEIHRINRYLMRRLGVLRYALDDVGVL
jgi:hypothetical protein